MKLTKGMKNFNAKQGQHTYWPHIEADITEYIK